MFDMKGRMIGVVSLNLGEVGKFSLAIPVDHYLDHRDELLRHGRCSLLCVSLLLYPFPVIVQVFNFSFNVG